MFEPNKHTVKGFETMQTRLLGRVESDVGDRNYCELNNQCDEFYTSIATDKVRGGCGQADVAAIDGDLHRGAWLAHWCATRPRWLAG